MWFRVIPFPVLSKYQCPSIGKNSLVCQSFYTHFKIVSAGMDQKLSLILCVLAVGTYLFNYFVIFHFYLTSPHKLLLMWLFHNVKTIAN